MPTYEFEIQNCIRAQASGETRDEARVNLIDSLDEYAEQMVDGSCYVSDGKLIKED